MIDEIRIIPIKNIGEISQNSPLPHIISTALQKQKLSIEKDDIFVITQKVISKAEGRIVNLDDITPSAFAQKIAEISNKDAPYIEVVLQETKRIVRMDKGILICETHHGFICANAGVDESNINNKHFVSLLPTDPDSSAQKIRKSLQEIHSKNIGIIISDTWGRPWRNGQVNMAIGISGLESLIDYRGQKDSYGYELQASIIAVADELASAAELVMGKTDNIPVAIIRGFQCKDSQGNAKSLLRDASIDLFR